MDYQYIISSFGKSDHEFDFLSELNSFCCEFNVLPFFVFDEIFSPGNFKQFVNGNNGFDLTPEISYNLASETINNLKEKIKQKELENGYRRCFVIFKREKNFIAEEDIIFI